VAKKTALGALLKRTMDKEERLVRVIDERDRNGKNMENVDSSYNNYEVNKTGDRVWSF